MKAKLQKKAANPFQDFGLEVAREGFEPPQTEPKSVVLPLDDRALRAQKYEIKFYTPNKTLKIFYPPYTVSKYRLSLDL